MDAIENILNRNSNKNLELPFPNDDEMKLVYKAALRAPDYAWLRPSQFIEVTGKGLDKLSKIFTDYIEDTNQESNDLIIQKYKNAPYRAPMIIVLVTNIKEHPKVSALEQMFSTAAAAQNILLALNALNYGAVWRTGAVALNDKIGKYFNFKKNQNILGYLYVGTCSSEPKKIPKLNIDDFVTKWK